jgi:hypothetical protein
MSYPDPLVDWLGSTSMGRISSEDACDLLRRAGLAAGAVLGSGMEGPRVFYDAAGRSARLRLAEIERVISVDGHTVSVERFVAGRRLSEQPSGVSAPSPAQRSTGSAMRSTHSHGFRGTPPCPACQSSPGS